MDKTLGVIGLIAVAVVIFVLSIDDQTPPMTPLSGKVNRQMIEGKTSVSANDLAPKLPSSRGSSDLTSSDPQLPVQSDAAGDPAVIDLRAQLKAEQDRVAQLTDKLGERWSRDRLLRCGADFETRRRSARLGRTGGRLTANWRTRSVVRPRRFGADRETRCRSAWLRGTGFSDLTAEVGRGQACCSRAAREPDG